MKLHGRYWKKLFVSAGALLMGCAASAGVTTATVQAVSSGAAEYLKSGAAWQVLEAGAAVEEGSKIRTDAAGVVDLDLGANGPWLRISPASLVEFVSLRQVDAAGEVISTTKIKVHQGKVGGVVRKLSRASQFLVVTDQGTFSLSGAEFVGTADGQVTVQKGEAAVLYAAAGQKSLTRHAVQTGQTFSPKGNQGRGEVMMTSAALAAEVALYMDGFDLPPSNDIAKHWVAGPFWLAVPRPFDEAQGRQNPPWIIPQIEEPLIPATKIEP